MCQLVGAGLLRARHPQCQRVTRRFRQPSELCQVKMASVELWSGTLVCSMGVPICSVAVMGATGAWQLPTIFPDNTVRLSKENYVILPTKDHLMSTGYSSFQLVYKAGSAAEWTGLLKHMAGLRQGVFEPTRRRVPKATVGNFDVYLFPPFADRTYLCDSEVTSEAKVDLLVRLPMLNQPTPPGTPSPARDSPTDSQKPAVNPAHPNILVTMAQQHASWLFGALAELSDNSYDKRASHFSVYLLGQLSQPLSSASLDSVTDPVLVVEDNGVGMNRDDLVRLLQLGHSQEPDPTGARIGRYGVGFKSGTMRLGKDAIVLTKQMDASLAKESTVSVGMLSQTLGIGANTISLPMVTLTWPDFEPHTPSNTAEEVEVVWQQIERVAPFNRRRLLYELGSMKSRASGTKILIWNLHQDPSTNKLQLALKDEPRDILIRGERTRTRGGAFRDADVRLDYSLAEYLSALYLKPHMTITLQGRTFLPALPLSRLTRRKCYEQKFANGRAILEMGFSEEEKERHNYGVNYYHKQRLIRTFRRDGLLQHGHKAFGVVGILQAIDKPPNDQACQELVVPVNNKQDFEDTDSVRLLDEWVEHCAEEYWEEHFGLSVDHGMAAEAGLQKEWWVQCSSQLCGKWRRLKQPLADPAAHWYCYNNTDTKYKDCGVPEEAAAKDEVTVKVRHGNKYVEGRIEQSSAAGKATGNQAGPSDPSPSQPTRRAHLPETDEIASLGKWAAKQPDTSRRAESASSISFNAGGHAPPSTSADSVCKVISGTATSSPSGRRQAHATLPRRRDKEAVGAKRLLSIQLEMKPPSSRPRNNPLWGQESLLACMSTRRGSQRQ